VEIYVNTQKEKKLWTMVLQWNEN